MRERVEVCRFEDRDALFQSAAGRFADAVAPKLERGEICRVAVSGGSLPDGWFAALKRFVTPAWRRIEWFWVDERCVAPDSPDNNFARAWRYLRLLELPAANFYRIAAGEPLAAEGYARLLAQRLELPENAVAVCDFIQLGMGPDGHFASLFPGSPALEEDTAWVLQVPPPVTALPAVARVTLTLPVLNRGGRLLFLIAGAEKLRKLEETLSLEPSPARPVSLLRPEHAAIEFLTAL